MNNDATRPRRRRGIYLLPNLLTTAALFAGFFAILSAMKGRFEVASIAIFVAMLLDGLDGRVARLTNTQSDFGAEYDSLSDMVAFGLAPALVIHLWALGDLGKVGWLAAFVYTAGTALRLARFNTQIGKADRRFFQGLPSPSAAAIVAASVWIGVDAEIEIDHISWAACILTGVVGLLMVSNFRYHSFKELDFRGKVPFLTIVVVMLVFAIVLLQPPLVLFSMFLLYAGSGPVLTLVRLRKHRVERRKAQRSEDTES